MSNNLDSLKDSNFEKDFDFKDTLGNQWECKMCTSLFCHMTKNLKTSTMLDGRINQSM